MDKIEELLTRGVANIIPNKALLEKSLRYGKKLNVYLGIDPTATRIHLGHAVPLRKLQQLSDLGHNVTFLIGDFTALIGDTSDKDTERPVLTSQQIQENFKSYKNQAEKILDFSKIKVRYNSEWLNRLSFPEIVKLTQQYSFGDFASRELIKKRLKEGRHVGLSEGLYPAMQGYDSYLMDTDIQVGGTDQTFNMQAGRILQKNWRNKESFIIATEFLIGTDGKKMSKTWGNAIWLEDSADDMYAKVMAIKDNLIIQYFALATNIPLTEIEKIRLKLNNGNNPMIIKKQLAEEIVLELHSKESAANAAGNFEKRVQNKETPENVKLYIFKVEELGIIDILRHVKFASSNSEAKGLIEQGGVSIDGEVIRNPNQNIKLDKEKLLKVGKRKYAKIKI